MPQFSGLQCIAGSRGATGSGGPRHEAVPTVTVQRVVADMEEEELQVTPTRRLSLGAVNAQTWELMKKLGKQK